MATHAHADHMGGFLSIVGDLDITSVSEESFCHAAFRQRKDARLNHAAWATPSNGMIRMTWVKIGVAKQSPAGGLSVDAWLQPGYESSSPRSGRHSMWNRPLVWDSPDP